MNALASALLERCLALPPAQTPLLLAVSGGCDSMLMLDLLRSSGQWPLDIFHLDHQLRSDSEEDAAIVRDYCLHYALPLHLQQAPIAVLANERGQGIEACAREERYQRLQQLAESLSIRFIATAHHRDDHLESIILHSLRGAADHGLAGMAAQRPLGQCTLIRPLLQITRAELRACAAESGLQWHEDSSNQDLQFRRNHVRHVLIPSLEKQNPGFCEGLLQQAAEKRQQLQLREAVVDQEWQHCLEAASIRVVLLEEWAEETRRLFWRRVLMHFALPLSQKNIARLNGLLQLGVSKQIELGDWCFVRNPEQIAWQQREQEHIEEITLADVTQINGLQFICRDAGDIDPRALDPEQACISKAAVQGQLILRTVQDGESWQAFGAPGRKNVFQYLSDKKYPIQQRRSLIVVADDDGVLWIPGLTIAERARVSEGDAALLLERQDA